MIEEAPGVKTERGCRGKRRSNAEVTPKLALIAVGVFLAVFVAIPIFAGIIVGNHAVSLEASCERSAGDINAQLTRRAQLIPDLVSTVKSAGAYERNTQLDVIEQRASRDETGSYSASIEIQAVAEAYPDLKNNENYQSLMTELSVTENLLFQYRSAYNTQARDYNVFTRQQPWAFVLGVSGYQVKTFDYTEDASDGYSAPGALFD